MTIKLITFSIVIIILIIIPYIAKRIVYKKLTAYLSKGEYEAFEKLLDGFICTFSFRPYNREYMRLTSYFMQNDTKKIEGQLDTMFQRIKMNDVQRVSVARRGFYFYLENNQLHKTKKMYEICMNEEKENSGSHTMELLYGILVLKKSDYIQEITERLSVLKKQSNIQTNHAQLVRIGIFEYMLGLQYFYQQNKKEGTYFLTSALRHCIHTPYEKQIRAFLESKDL